MSTVEPGGELPVGGPGPTVLRMMLGNQLHQLREAADVTPDQAGYEIRASRSKISRMEHGRVGFKDRDVADLLTLYGVTDEQMRARMLASVRHANAPGWWSKYGDLLPDWFEEYLGLEGRPRSSAPSSCSSCTGCSRPRPMPAPSHCSATRPPRPRRSTAG